MFVESSIIINSSPEKVWEIITQIEHAANILSGVEQIQILSQPTSGLIGLKWIETRIYFGKPTSIDKWITETEEMVSYRTCSEMDGYIFITTFKISEEGLKVKLMSSHKTIATNFLAKIKSLPILLFVGILKKAIDKDLKDYKNAVEQFQDN